MDRKQFRLGAGSGPNQRGNRFKSVGFIALIVLFGLITYAAFNQPSTLKEVPFSETISEANSGQLKRIEINGAELTITPQGEDHPTEKSYKEEGSSIYEQGLEQGKVEVINKPQSSDSLWLGLLTGVLPVIIIAAILILMFRSAQGQGNQALSFGKSRSRL